MFSLLQLFLPQRYLCISTVGVERVVGGKTFFWSGRYHDDMNTRTTVDTQLNVLENFSPKVPEEFQDSQVVVIGNLHPAGCKLPITTT